MVYSVKGGSGIKEDEYYSLSTVKCLHDVIVNTHDCCGADDTRSGTGQAVVFVNVAPKVSLSNNFDTKLRLDIGR